MSRTANQKRPEELADAIVQYLIQHGLADLSLRPLARAVGSSPRVLLYYFGSKEKMIARVLANLRQRQRAVYAAIPAGPLEQSYWAVWKHMSSPKSEALFRLFFEIYGVALHHPQRYKEFLRTAIDDWLAVIVADVQYSRFPSQEARAFATIVLAGFRGFMLDYCATHDRKRLDHAVKLWIGTLLPNVPNNKDS